MTRTDLDTPSREASAPVADATRSRLREHVSRVEAALRTALAPYEGTLAAVAREIASAGGKRMRPVICVEAAVATGGSVDDALGLAVAIELVHAMSLVHDDLPAMDDSALRRGMPACHVAHGEAVAILVGDELLAHAFAILVRSIPRGRASLGLSLVEALSGAAGFHGMAGAQAEELGASRTLAPTEVARIADGKTGALFVLAAEGGARLGGGTPEQIEGLERFGRHLGRAFQAIDDLRDAAPPEQTGKPPGQDAMHGRPTTVVCFGPTHARTVALRECALARESLATLGDRGDGLASVVHDLETLVHRTRP